MIQIMNRETKFLDLDSMWNGISNINPIVTTFILQEVIFWTILIKNLFLNYN